jgi:hypothetical protein
MIRRDLRDMGVGNPDMGVMDSRVRHRLRLWYCLFAFLFACGISESGV